MSKYGELSKALSARTSSLVRMDFEDIERALGFTLPSSARKHPEWWSNNYGGHVQARAWMDAGWRTEALDIAGEKVSFRRLKPKASMSQNNNSGPAEGTASQPKIFGCMAGTVTFIPNVDLTEPTEDTWNAERGTSLNE